MRAVLGALLLISSLACFPALVGYGQDAPSLGDAARRARQQQKDQPGNGPAAAKAVRVLSDEDSPQRPEEPRTSTPSDQSHAANNASTAPAGPKVPAEQWKAKIQAQKNAISSLQSQIDKVNDSIQFAPANCVAGCVQWNEHQKRKQQEVDRARDRLEEMKKHLAEMQEACRQQGYGSSVYDP